MRILLCAAVVCLVLFTGPIPGTSQWYNLHGLQILVSLLCIAGLERVRTLKHRRLAVSLTWAVLLLAPGNLIPNYIWDWARVSPEELEYFRPMALSRTLAWMRKNIPDTAVVLTDLKTVYHVPYKTGCRVAVGPPEQTRYYTQKAYEQMMWRQRADDPKRSFLTRHEISHILLTPVFTTGLHPDKISGLVARGVLRRIHKDNEFSVYETDLDLARSGPKATNASPR